MELSKWKSLPENQQHELIVQWSKDDSNWLAYQDMAERAAAALKRELASLPEITNVQVGGGRVLHVGPRACVIELVLNVCTLLSESDHLERIPSRFSGFSVHQLNLGDKRESFLRTWQRLFKELRGWDETKTLMWAEKWDDALSGRRPLAVYHYGPVKVALSALVDDSVKAAAGERLHLLYSELRNVLERTESVDSQRIVHPDEAEDYDWEYVRRRTSQLFEEYGGKPG